MWQSGVKRYRAPAFKHILLFPAFLAAIIYLWNYDILFAKQQQRVIYGYTSGTSNAGACDKWQGAKDVVVVMKTGASEIEAKLPVHFNTTFRCAPNVMVFSDMAQEIEGMRVYDPLRHLVHELNQTDPDVRYYLDLRERQKKKEDIVKGNNMQAWALDRYKNVPMLRQAYNAHPETGWFVFMDADTALIWPNVLIWLSQMDPSEPHYIGSSAIGSDDIRFAHGGSGYIISHAAAKLVAEETKEEQKKSFEISKEDCCGDSALAKVLRLHNVLITPAFPNINGQTMVHLDYNERSLCFALVTMHHMNSKDITELAMYQDRISNGQAEAIRYADLFYHLVRPQLADRKAHWNNASPHLVVKARFGSGILSYNECQLRCKKDKLCLQFSYQQDGLCKLSRSVLLGRQSNEQIESGWLLDRIQRFVEQEGTCAVQWILA